MNHELVNRTLTSLLLLPVLVYATYYSGIYLIALLSIVYLISFYEIIKNTKNLLFIAISNFFLIFAFFSFYYLRGSTNYSLFTIYWILISTILSDIGGYTLGKTLKGKKLTKISPNKTYSGSAGSFLFSLFSLPFLNFIQSFVFSEMFINFYQIKYLLLTLAISTVCQFGDLYVSYWKRRSKIKDISNILPGHGGALDRIDGLIFVLIFSLILKKSGLI
jgi:phosphatidate cytidylyltransferase